MVAIIRTQELRSAMSEITPELLHLYLDDALSEEETARVEQGLRTSDPWRRLLRAVMQERDRGEHSIGAVWRRQRLSCPSRDQLGSYLLDALDEGSQDYVDFHLKTVGCPYCNANAADLQALRQEAPPKTQARRRRFFESSAGYLHIARQAKR